MSLLEYRTEKKNSKLKQTSVEFCRNCSIMAAYTFDFCTGARKLGGCGVKWPPEIYLGSNIWYFYPRCFERYLFWYTGHL